jgi:hypothetical protein
MTGYLACNGHLKPIEEIICGQCKAAEEKKKKDVITNGRQNKDGSR